MKKDYSFLFSNTRRKRIASVNAGFPESIVLIVEISSRSRNVLQRNIHRYPIKLF